MKQFDWDKVRDYFPSGSTQESLISPPNPTDDGLPADYMVYLNVATRNFFTAKPGELVVFNGIPVAHGLILQVRSGRSIPTTYVRGHSVEHLTTLR